MKDIAKMKYPLSSALVKLCNVQVMFAHICLLSLHRSPMKVAPVSHFSTGISSCRFISPFYSSLGAWSGAHFFSVKANCDFSS